ncbi:MAG: hypothetical protein U5L73_05990 [Rhodoferax sp.]|uniref:hypothetical protein n=1 Tax=Rhodoferax sp. TaxID=50421 RepID=UPI002ACE7D4C|nr:hypothetical protein [Rhodoferax sp.]MDZ7891294.1 hypothetical protein [Rhodoferax sp.]
MTAWTRRITTLAIALLFGCVMAGIEPYPHQHDALALAVGTVFFLAVATSTQHAALQRLWLAYGLTTITCYSLVYLWFWWGAMRLGWWYPTPPPLIQQWFFVDGEGGHDAMVSNLFLVLWCVTSLVFAVSRLRHTPEKSL